MPKKLAIIGAKYPLIEVKTAPALRIRMNLAVLPRKVQKMPTIKILSMDSGCTLVTGKFKTRIGVIIIVATKKADPVSEMDETLGII